MSNSTMENSSSTEILPQTKQSPLDSSAENSADEQTVDQLLEQLDLETSKHKEEQNINIIELLRKEFERKDNEKECKAAVLHLFKDDQERY